MLIHSARPGSKAIKLFVYSKICLKRPLKIGKTKVLKTNGSLMKVESIVEFSPWRNLQYF